MGSTSLLSYLLVSLFAYQALSQGTVSPCCATKKVTDAPDTDLNGEYVLKDTSASDENCLDACLYTRDDEEYCFKAVPAVEGATIACNTTSGSQGVAASTLGAEAGSSTPGVGESIPGAEGSSPGAETGDSTPGAGGGTTTTNGGGTTQSAADKGQAAQEALKSAKADLAVAQGKKNAADDSATTTAAVETKINDIIAGSETTTTAGAGAGRMKREDAPTNCTEFNSMVKRMNTEINKKTTDGFIEATRLGKILVTAVVSLIKCDAEALNALKTTKTEVAAAKEVLVAVSAEQQKLIKNAIETINAAIAIIKELIANGQTGFADPGTMLATVTVPSLATQAPAAGPTTPAVETEPTGVAGTTTSVGGAEQTTSAIGPGTSSAVGGPGTSSAVGGPGTSSAVGGPGTTAGKTTTPRGSGVTIFTTGNPNGRLLLYGKRSRGSIL